jgi:hypothetical protein
VEFCVTVVHAALEQTAFPCRTLLCVTTNRKSKFLFSGWAVT